MNQVRGRVVSTPSFHPVSDVVVVVFDLDNTSSLRESGGGAGEVEFRLPELLVGGALNSFGSLGDRLGSVLTDRNGEFQLEYEDAEFRIRNQDEKRPDLCLLLLAPEAPGVSAKELILFHTQE